MEDDINVRGDKEDIPLHSACEFEQAATIQYLCEHCALLGLQDNNRISALHVAVSNGHLDATRDPLEKGANLCAADASGLTALHIAAKSEYLNTVQYLADSFAPTDMRNTKKETELPVAAAEGHEKIVSFLMEQGAGIGVQDREGKTALDIATVNGSTAIIQVKKDRAEGKKLVFPIPCIDLNTNSEFGNAEQLHPMNVGECTGTAIDRNGNYAPWVLKTSGEDTMEVHSKPRSTLHTAAVNGNLGEMQ